MKKKIGMIGCGNMGSAMLRGIISSNLVQKQDIYINDLDESKMNALKHDLGVHILPPKKLAEEVDILLLAVKPAGYTQVINDLKDHIKENTIIVSIIAGIKLKQLEELFDQKVKIVRVMPNTPALVGEGMSALTQNEVVTKEEIEGIKEIFQSFGKAEVVSENLMDIVTAVSGSGPAFIFMLIEAMADEAVKEGMPRDKAYVFASQTVLGSAKMVLETKKHPGQLKDMVTSPSGTTIEGVYSLEKTGFRHSIMKAISKACEKSKKIGK